MEVWTSDIRTIVFSRIKGDLISLKSEKGYENFTLTTSTVSSTKPKFPTLVFQRLYTPEVGQDLENTNVNAVNAGFQIDVIDNGSDDTKVEKILDKATKSLKKMGFSVTREPNMDTQDEKRGILRATRYIAQGDIL